MAKQVIKINTVKPIIKVGDIVQFNNLDPVKAVKFTECNECCMSKLDEVHFCSGETPYCNYFEDEDLINGAMFKAIKIKE